MERPDDPAYELLLNRARARLRARDLVGAEDAAGDALRHDPARGAAYNVLAIIRLLRARLPAAKAMLRAGMAIDPGCHELQTNLPRIGRTGIGPLMLGDEPSDARPDRA
jgi:Tfp pilus assembly protein PilF